MRERGYLSTEERLRSAKLRFLSTPSLHLSYLKERIIEAVLFKMALSRLEMAESGRFGPCDPDFRRPAPDLISIRSDATPAPVPIRTGKAVTFSEVMKFSAL